jgi:hypothetical protein
MATSMAAASTAAHFSCAARTASNASASSRPGPEGLPQTFVSPCRYSNRRGFLSGASEALGSGSNESIRGRQIAAPVMKKKLIQPRFKVPSAVSDSGLGQADTDLTPDAGKVSASCCC